MRLDEVNPFMGLELTRQTWQTSFTKKHFHQYKVTDAYEKYIQIRYRQLQRWVKLG